jgi:outer membrane protein assembly factor BamA
VYEENVFSGNHEAFRKNISSDPKNNLYNRLFYRYNIFHPGLSFAYNIDDGLFIGAKAQYTRHGFRKEPYSMRHTLSAGHALRTSSWFFRYLGEITEVLGRHDLVLKADVRAPVNVTNFFGYGNFTEFNKGSGISYYRVRYNITDVSALLRRQMQSWMRILYGPTFQTFRLDEDQNKGRFVNDLTVNGLDPNTLHERKTYAGAEFALDINSRNNQVLPTRGFLLDAGVRQLYGLNSNSGNLTQLRWDMSIIASFVPQAKLVFATRLGWYHNIGDFEFPQANYLGGTQNLRGFRRDRFAGRTTLFNNSEVRMKLGNFTTYLFPGSLGLLAFHDIGRVYADNEDGKKWHSGFGGGIWIAPIQRFVLTASVARSKEETVPYITFGFQF